MANFITNSTGTKALRLSLVASLEIVQSGESEYNLVAYLSGGILGHGITFETDATSEGIGAKAETVMTALET